MAPTKVNISPDMIVHVVPVEINTGYGYHVMTFIPKIKFNNTNFETHQAILLDADGYVLQESNTTLRLKIDTIDAGVFQLQGTCGSSYQTIGLTTILNLNGTDFSIPTKSLITSLLGEKSAIPYCLFTGVEAQWSAELGKYEVKGPRNFRPFFDANPDVTNPPISWTELIDKVTNQIPKDDVTNIMPDIVVLLTSFINNIPLLQKLKFEEKK